MPTDPPRTRGESLGLRLDRINWGNYDLVVIDESHNFRNADYAEEKESRYQRLMRQVIREGVKTYSQWPTIPQLYIDGEFQGGCDIVREMYASGELKEKLGAARQR